MMRNKYIYLLYIGVAALMSASCNSWLDVQPRSQVEDTELFVPKAAIRKPWPGVYFFHAQYVNLCQGQTYGFIVCLDRSGMSIIRPSMKMRVV